MDNDARRVIEMHAEVCATAIIDPMRLLATNKTKIDALAEKLTALIVTELER